MDKNGQLTFSDDPILNGINEVYQLIEKGEFASAVEKIDQLMDIDADYPGLIEAYRVAKFWHNREKEIKTLEEGKDTAEYLMKAVGGFQRIFRKQKSGLLVGIQVFDAVYIFSRRPITTSSPSGSSRTPPATFSFCSTWATAFCALRNTPWPSRPSSTQRAHIRAMRGSWRSWARPISIPATYRRACSASGRRFSSTRPKST